MLPPPGADARRHSARLLEVLRRRIGTGSIGFEAFMESALYAPGLGYYMAGLAQFGAPGDFVTAPEIAPEFARCLANAIAAVHEQTGAGDVLEVGGGSGALAAGVLQALAKRESLPQRYWLLEISPALCARQRERIARLPGELAGRVRWASALPRGLRGVVFANEVADALPVTRFRCRPCGVDEIRTAWRDGRLCDQESAAGPALRQAVAALQADLGQTFAAGFASELSPTLDGWVRALAGALEQGLLLLIDYGYPRAEYYAPQRDGGTLVCHYRHRAHADPYWYPGLQDISASVDFTAVAEAASGAGLELQGFTSQAGFLIDNGILDDAGHGAQAALTPQGVTASARLQTLLMPDQMGERFGVLGFSRGLETRVPGFQSVALSRRL